MGTEIAKVRLYLAQEYPGFHSIGIPSEWGPTDFKQVGNVITSFHSIGIPSEWGRRIPMINFVSHYFSFHSIGIPSEWGPELF